MKSVIMLAALFTLCLSQTMAQKETKNFSVGFGLEAGAPTGAMSELVWRSLYGLGINILLDIIFL